MTLNNANFINQINILVISVEQLTTRYWCYKSHNQIDEDSSQSENKFESLIEGRIP